MAEGYQSLDELIACAVSEFDEEYDVEVGGPLGIPADEFIDEIVADWAPVKTAHLAALVAADPSLGDPSVRLEGDVAAQDKVVDAVSERLTAALRERLSARNP